MVILHCPECKEPMQPKYTFNKIPPLEWRCLRWNCENYFHRPTPGDLEAFRELEEMEIKKEKERANEREKEQAKEQAKERAKERAKEQAKARIDKNKLRAVDNNGVQLERIKLLESENADLREKNKQLESEIADLRERNRELESENASTML